MLSANHASFRVFGALCLLLASAARAEVKITQAEDRSVQVTTSVYAAQIDGKGNLTHLTVKGAKAFAHQFGDPGKPPAESPSVRVVNAMVAVRSGAARVEWTFGEDTLDIVTEGYNFECQLDPSCRAVVAPGGKGGPFMQYAGGADAVILANDTSVVFTQGMHVHLNRLLPRGYTSGGIKPGALFETQFKLGAPADAAQLLSAIELRPVGTDSANRGLLEGGNQGWGVTHFAATQAIGFTSGQKNLSDTEFALEYRLSILDHYVAGKEVNQQQQKAVLAAKGGVEQTWQVPALPPGFYYATVSAWRGEQKLTESKLSFTVDLPHYSHALTRPADWAEFWARQNQRLRDLPAAATETLVSDPANPNKAWAVSLDVPGAGRIRALLIVPAKLGTGPTQFGSLLDGPLDAEIAKARLPGWQPGEDIALTTNLPEDATYTTWKSAEDNNLLNCVLCCLRAVDYLAARPEMKGRRIQVNGASRSGPLAVMTAALRPDLIAAVSAFVHTSAGISWEDKPYYAWGLPGGHNPADPAAVHALAQLAAYVDPVNHAPDVKCPIIFGWGLDDSLAWPQGIEAMYQLCGSSWKRISRDAGGHQYSKGFQQLQKDLATHLQAPAQTGTDERILKDH